MSKGWHTLVVTVPLKPDRDAGLAKLRLLERWLAENHKPVPLFRPDGQPRTTTVCVAVPVENAAKALAWRSFCAQLGLSGSMVQWHVAAWRPHRQAETTRILAARPEERGPTH